MIEDESSTMEMDPDLAKRLFDQGAVLIVAGVPMSTEFGIDLCSYQIGERFRGIKMIPPGPHYVYCASKGPYGDTAPRVGFLHFFKPQEILVREWDANTEELRERKISDPELEKRRIRENLKDLDRFLGAYDYRFLDNWRHLTDAITEEGVHRCSPECGIIRTNIPLLSCPDSDRPRGNTSSVVKISRVVIDENDLLPSLKPIPGTAPQFTELPKKIPKDSSPSDVSKHHMDCIDAVRNLLEMFSKPVDLIEEIQIAFTMFVAGYCIEALGHWRKILNLLSNSESGVSQYKLFYMKYLEVLQYQMPHIPEELFEQTDHNTVYKDIKTLLVNCMLNGLTVNAEKLIKNLEKSMKWKFDGLLDEDPDDMPVIVETDE